MAGGIRESSSSELEENHEINVTPFIDVMLVLLIIFMVAAPLATVDVPVNLPASTATPQPKPEEPVYLTVQKDLTLSVDERPVQGPALAAALDAKTAGNREQPIFLRADKDVPYGEIMKAMNLLRGAGYLKVAMVGLEQLPAAPPAEAATP
jgi:biopolymer transport protein ExbD